MNWQEAILTVLRKAGEPMAYKDIAAEIVRRGLVNAPHTNPEIATHAAITGLKVDGLVTSAPRGKYRLPE
ncbi:winged helix-turn-helix domain-containing protein [Corynebacterium afermentans subsp. lipophilum]|uniref:winged helix-turn-helix domain-containing protein n=1 Tax=Corynebacterium afermentans TaxID=38286 RepID=UPI00188AA066|nr:winged helix-turn-helix domain-containing protein [Corynebacterium afermentans]MBF4547212.1 winged helix-turn-helix domain-containing protein [Corynebacterium afermentans subsp. lipophilum]WJY59936.1 hypothetical protein CAFEL_11010 [Corynebacterium afermentans subsp. lipophilum]